MIIQTPILPTLIRAPSLSRASQGEDTRETFDALFNGVQQGIAVSQADTVASHGPRRGKTYARIVVHLRGAGFFEHCLRINVIWQGQPEEHTALGMGPRRFSGEVGL